MFKSYFKIAWRNLLKERLFTLLNLAGLSTGLACALLIWLWIADERQKEHYNPKDAQLYQVMQNLHESGQILTMSYTSGLLADGLKAQFPEVDLAATVVPATWFDDKGRVIIGDTILTAGGQFVSKDYFKLFTCPFVAGDNRGVSGDKNSVAIARSLAVKLFGSPDNALGKTLQWKQGEFDGSYSITGVYVDNPPNATEHPDVLFNFGKFVEKRTGMKEWGNSDPDTYIRLHPGTDIPVFNAKIAHFLDGKDKYEKKDLFVRRFSNKYLYDTYTNGVLTGGRIQYVKLFTLIALFILGLACINFMNLSTARASRRIKEVGIKKVVGAHRSTLVLQYLGESVLMSTLALLVAGCLVALLLPAFNTLTDKTLSLRPDGYLIVTVAGITLLTGLVAGSYPALYLSGFKPIAVLKGKLRSRSGELFVRKGLVVFQFALSVMAIASVITIYRQTRFIQTKDLGYSRDHVVAFSLPSGGDSLSLLHAAAMINTLKTLPGVVSVGSHQHNLTGVHGGIGGLTWPGKNPSEGNITFANLEVGDGFIETMGIRIKEGRNIADGPNAHNEIVFNEAAIKFMGLKDPIGKTISFWGHDRQIVGVAQDFNFESLYKGITPAFFQLYPVIPNVIVKIKAGSEHATITAIGATYRQFYRGAEFDYHFLDEEYQALYATENRVATLSKYFAGLAILISCLGLFGLAAFTAQRRQKEIGIRKVIGASTTAIALMLSKDFFRLILIAILVAFPLTWWLMGRWLDKFAYRIPLGADVFLIAGLSILGITLLTIGFQALKAAGANPVGSLRSE